MDWATPEMLLWLWAIPPLAGLLALTLIRRRRATRRFVDAELIARVVPGGGTSAALWWLKSALVVIAAGAVVLALARPRFNLPGEEPPALNEPARGRDVCIIIDVSKSMLAEDLKPNRLERAKLWVKDVLEVVRGDRVAIVAFSGTAVVKCPLTHDYAFARLQLESLSPISVTRGGTNIGDAVRLAISEVFAFDASKPPEASFRDILLITDGEDHESSPVDAAAKAGALGVRLITVGIGDESEGARIPITDDQGRRTFVTSAGREVVSRLDPKTLQAMALATPGGTSFNVGLGTIELDKVYRSLIGTADKRAADPNEKARESDERHERFQWLIGLALALLMIEHLLPERRRIKA